MKIDVLTIFPEMFKDFFSLSLMGKAIEKGLIEAKAVDIRSFSKDKHKKVDDKPFGGGTGMVIKAEPVFAAIRNCGALKKNACYKNRYKKPYVIYMSPQGRPLDNGVVKELSKFERLIILCGHYEGIDERAMSFVDDEISIGDYVLTGGEIPAMVLIDAVSRMIKGVVKEEESVKNDSFYNGLLDYPHYTRPAVFKNMKAPEVLLSGNHKKIQEWRLKQSYERTKKRRPDLLKAIKNEE
ncbi:MAG: tRNA (guanosine(37)-N1)-methyltransferase TrmD [Endomicrobium sp.]|jgi:tRNA (guanine37-N1)-methyltransferase|nr:tRNA (guanosine(37)-N1)-methyltransferase TrmD [Endomicrobium sp.]